MRRFLPIMLCVAACMAARAQGPELPSPPGCPDFRTNGSGIAGADCDAAIARETDPRAKAMLLFRRAYIKVTPGDFDKYPDALNDLDQAVRLDPGNWVALHERAYVYNEQGRWSEALADLDRAVALAPEDLQTYQERALSDFHLAHLQATYDDRDKVIALGGTDSGNLLSRAEAAMWLGRFVQASNDLEAGTRAADATDNGYETKRAGELKIILQHLTATSGDSKAAALCTTAENKPESDPNLIGDCTRAFLDATTDKDRAFALTTRSIAWRIWAKDDTSALFDLEIAEALQPDSPAALSNLAFGYMDARHSTAALPLFDRSIALEPGFANYAGRARAKYNLKDLDGADADARKSNAYRENEIADIVLGDIAFARKDNDAAKAHWLDAYKLGARDDGMIDRLKAVGATPPS